MIQFGLVMPILKRGNSSPYFSFGRRVAPCADWLVEVVDVIRPSLLYCEITSDFKINRWELDLMTSIGYFFSLSV
jgi:hypothetical protein